MALHELKKNKKIRIVFLYSYSSLAEPSGICLVLEALRHRLILEDSVLSRGCTKKKVP